MPNSIFFPQKGTKNSQFAADSQSEKFKYKNWICTAIHKFQKNRSEEG